MKNKSDKNKLKNLLLRYAIIILVALPNLWLFYTILTPLTVYPVFFLLNLFFDATLAGNFIFINNQIPIEIIPACVAGAAYYLLFILNLSIPSIELKKRTKMVLFSFGSLLILNILRIFVLSIFLISENASLFDITHRIFWYLISIVFVVGIWFSTVKIFRIKDVPFYSDIKYLFAKSSLKKKSKNSKRSRKH